MSVGDVVICLKKGNDDRLIVGEKYKIDAINYNYDLRIKNEMGKYYYYPEEYFTSISRYRNMKIDELLEE